MNDAREQLDPDALLAANAAMIGKYASHNKDARLDTLALGIIAYLRAIETAPLPGEQHPTEPRSPGPQPQPRARK